MMEYIVAFDVIQAGYRQWSFPAHGLIFVGLGVLTVRFRKFLPWWTLRGEKRIVPPLFGYTILAFSALWTLVAFFGAFGDYSVLGKALRDDRLEFVEGVVTNFIPMPYEGHSRESFEVKGRRFDYSDFHITAGFNNTKSHGGPIDEGVHVRIWHKDNKIARLEVGKGIGSSEHGASR
jgi:hypothetical protein